MGQLALGLRSLLIRAGIFFVMAALLASALGGTLWPRDERVDFEPVVRHDGREWFWRLVISGRPPRDAAWWLMTIANGDEPQAADDMSYLEVAGPLVVDGTLYYAGRPVEPGGGAWRIVRRDAAGQREAVRLPDRLAVEQQLARLEAGLPLQDAETVTQERPKLLEPGGS